MDSQGKHWLPKEKESWDWLSQERVGLVLAVVVAGWWGYRWF